MQISRVRDRCDSPIANARRSYASVSCFGLVRRRPNYHKRVDLASHLENRSGPLRVSLSISIFHALFAASFDGASCNYL